MEMHHTSRFAIRFMLLALVAAPFSATGMRAETAVLRNGQRMHITGYERDGEMIQLHVAGGRVALRTEDVLAIEPEE